MAALPAPAPEPLGGWRASLSLRFAPRDGRTIVADRRHEGPLLIQRAFYPGDGACHVYLLHPPGGVAGGDTLELDVHACADAAVLLTTPAATKIYRARRGADLQRALPLGRSTVRQSFTVAAGASLEWLPHDTILFGGSRAALRTHVRLDAAARFIGWEMTSLGRPLAGDAYAEGTLEQRTRIEIGGRAALDERAALAAGDPALDAPWGWAGHRVWGALYACPADGAALEAARRRLPPPAASAMAAATLLGPLLVVRCLAQSAERLRVTLETVWAALREGVVGRPASAPRIWQT
ncbi:MAG TPA: urease accessory protein UreD [Gammaproteobacteria bacterium]